MTGVVHIHHVAVGLAVTVPEELIETNVGYLPWVLGDSLAGQVQAHVANARLGYFPAMHYFRDPSTGTDQALLALIDQVGQFSVDYARRELRRRLCRVFSQIRVEQAQCMAYMLPRVRPGQPQSMTDLGKHFSPSRVKLELVLSSVARIPVDDPEGAALSKIEHWARAPFASLEILAVHAIGSHTAPS